MRSSDSRAFSDLPVPPGEILAKEIEDQGMTQKELAARLERPAQAINEIIKAKKAITADTAIGLEKALGIEAHFWSRLELADTKADYRMSLARNRERDRLAADVEWLNKYPISEMIERGWIQRPSEISICAVGKPNCICGISKPPWAWSNCVAKAQRWYKKSCSFLSSLTTCSDSLWWRPQS